LIVTWNDAIGATNLDGYSSSDEKVSTIIFFPDFDVDITILERSIDSI
jgi:hypothetical protein